jgi:hypothetical protein
MTERRFVLVDFTHMNRVGCLRLYEADQTFWRVMRLKVLSQVWDGVVRREAIETIRNVPNE